MSDFYKITNIKGKGLGCIALKPIKIGTLILAEKPQVVAKGMPTEAKFFRGKSL